MSRISDPPGVPSAPDREAIDTSYVCPFCGLGDEQGADRGEEGGPCPRCTMVDTPATRKATKARIGPWHVRQVRNPWAPGMKWETMLLLLRRGQINARSVVRGPTTHQLWRRASQVKGLSREFGVCYSCGGPIDRDANLCPHCQRLQEPPVNPDTLLETREITPVVREIVPPTRPVGAGAAGQRPRVPPTPQPVATENVAPPEPEAKQAAAATTALVSHLPGSREPMVPARSDAATQSAAAVDVDAGSTG